MNHFHKARMKLTMWYLLISGFLLTVFTAAAISAEALAFYRIERVFADPVERPRLTAVINRRFTDLHQDFRKLLIQIDIALFVLAGFGSYALSGLTLKPIEEMLNEQEAFAGEASHQLRTPLTIIKTELSAFRKLHPRMNGPVRTLTASILEETERMKRLTDSLLTLVRPASRETVAFDAVAATDTALNQLMRSNTTIRKRIEWHAPPEMLTVTGKGDDLVQIVEILADNALKYSQGLVAVTLNRSGREVLLTVTDRGNGIKKADLTHIFDRFYRGNHDGVAGSGLGLAIAKKLAKNLGGTIGATSRTGKGSVFTVRLPLTRFLRSSCRPAGMMGAEQ